MNTCPLRSAQHLLTYMELERKQNHWAVPRVSVAGRKKALGGHSLRLHRIHFNGSKQRVEIALLCAVGNSAHPW